jgi:FtsZ-binding cell division protein ZapB
MKKIITLVASLVLACSITLAGMTREEILKYNERVLKTNTPEGRQAFEAARQKNEAQLRQGQREWEHRLTSPYAGDLLNGRAKDGAHFLLIEYKCGSGCGDMALLLVNYDGVKIICPSLRDALQLKEFDIEGHGGVYFDRWDIPNGKLYLKADARGKGHNWEWNNVVYDLRTNKVTVGPEATR